MQQENLGELEELLQGARPVPTQTEKEELLFQAGYCQGKRVARRASIRSAITTCCITSLLWCGAWILPHDNHYEADSQTSTVSHSENKAVPRNPSIKPRPTENRNTRDVDHPNRLLTTLSFRNRVNVFDEHAWRTIPSEVISIPSDLELDSAAKPLMTARSKPDWN